MDGRVTRFSQFLMVAAVVLVLGLLTPAMFAQTVTTGDVTGTVTDSSGAIVQNAPVVLKNVDTNASRTVQSNQVGVYRFTLLSPGTYQISASTTGLKSNIGRIVVAVGQIQTVDLTLKPEEAREVIMVTDAVPLLQTENASIAASYSTKQLNLLPTPGGDITSAAFSVPGITMSTGAGYGNFSSHGLPAISNLFTMNGADVMDPYLNLNNTGASNVTIGANEIQETSVVQNAYEAQYGRQAGAQVTFMTKSGTNSLHGDLSYNYNGSFLNANDFFNNTNDVQKSRAISHQWGASGGGPIKKDKLFFFVDWEGLRYTLPTADYAVVPSQALQTYILNTVTAAQKPFYQKAFTLYNGAPGKSRAVPVVNGDGSLQDSAGGRGCGGLAGTSTGTGGIFGTNVSCFDTWGTNLSNQNKEWLLTGRGDINLNDKQKVYLRFKTDQGLQPTSTNLINPVFSAISNQPQFEGQINYTYVLSPRVVNNLIAESMYYSAIFGPKDLDAAYAAFPNRLSFGDGGSNAAYPSSLGVETNMPQGRRVGQLQLIDDVSYTKGNHLIKAGANYRYNRVTDTRNRMLSVAGSYVFNDLNSYATGIVSGVDTFQQRFAAFRAAHLRLYNLGLYVQDQWAATPSLKLTLAIRFDRTANPRCTDNCFSWMRQPFQFVAHEPLNAASAQYIPYNQSIIPGNSNAFYATERITPQPRFGFAFNPKSAKNTVIRGGIGVFSDMLPNNVVSTVFGNSPNTFLPTVATGIVGDSTLAGSSAAIAAASAKAFMSGFASGQNLSQLKAAVAPVSFALPTFTSIPEKLLNPKYIQWSFEVQQQIGTKSAFTVSYVGNHGYDGFVRSGTPNAYVNTTNYPSGFGGLPLTVPDQRFGQVVQMTNDGVSNYKGMSISFRRSLGFGFQGNIGYTLSRSKDTISNGGLQIYSGDSFTIMNSPSAARNYSASDYDVRHNVTADFVWEIPKKFENKVVDRALGGWSVSGKLYLRTGTPFSIYNSGIRTRLGNMGTLGSVNVLAEGLSSQIPYSCDSSAVDKPCFTTSQFNTRTAQTNFGNMPRNSTYGPGYFDLDMSLYKRIAIGEKLAFTLGAQAFNTLNHPNFASPGMNVNTGGVGLITSTVGAPTSPYGSFQGSAVSGRVLVLTGKVSF